MFSRKGRFGLPLYELGLGMLVAAILLGVAAFFFLAADGGAVASCG